MKHFFLLIVIVVHVSTSLCQSPDFKISEMFPVEAEHSYVGFSIQYMGYAMVRGRFKDFRGSIRFNERDLTKTSVSLTITAGSIDTGNDWRDDDLRSENWFGCKEYPAIQFSSKSVAATPDGIRITGDLTMHGTTKTITFPMACIPKILKDVRDDSQIIFTGNVTLNRLDFGIEGKKWAGVKEGITAVSDIVSVELTILGKRINAGNFKYWVANPESPHGKVYKVAKENGIKAALLTFDSLKTSAASKVDVETLNTVGLMLLKENNVSDAIAIFKRNLASFPDQPVVYQSYGEAMATSGNWAEALKYYTLALSMDPGNMNAKEILRHIPK